MDRVGLSSMTMQRGVLTVSREICALSAAAACYSMSVWATGHDYIRYTGQMSCDRISFP